MNWFYEAIGDPAGQLMAVVVLSIIIVWRVHKWIDRNWLGNAGGHAKCIVCQRDCCKRIPVIGVAFGNPLRARPPIPRIIYDFTDPRRLCPAHHQERLGKLHLKVSHFRTEVLSFSRTKYAAMTQEDRAALDELGKKAEEPPKASQASAPDARVQGWPTT